MSSAQRTSLRIVAGGPRTLNLEALVSSIAAGDGEAAARLHDATSGLVFGLLLLMLSDTATAEKVLLEVYSEVRTNAARFDRNQDSLLVWLVTIAHRRALEHLCSSTEDQQFLVSVGLAQRSGLVGRSGISKSRHRRLVSATLDAWSTAERKIVELAYFSRMTPRAIALELRQTQAFVSAALQSGISRLYILFKNQELGGELRVVKDS